MAKFSAALDAGWLSMPPEPVVRAQKKRQIARSVILELISAAADAVEEVSELQCQPHEAGTSRADTPAMGTREDASSRSAMVASHQPNPHVEIRSSHSGGPRT